MVDGDDKSKKKGKTDKTDNSDKTIDFTSSGQTPTWSLPTSLASLPRDWIFMPGVEKWMYFNKAHRQWTLYDRQLKKTSWDGPPPTAERAPDQEVKTPAAAPAPPVVSPNNESVSAGESFSDNIQQPREEEQTSAPSAPRDPSMVWLAQWSSASPQAATRPLRPGALSMWADEQPSSASSGGDQAPPQAAPTNLLAARAAAQKEKTKAAGKPSTTTTTTATSQSTSTTKSGAAPTKSGAATSSQSSAPTKTQHADFGKGFNGFPDDGRFPSLKPAGKFTLVQKKQMGPIPGAKPKVATAPPQVPPAARKGKPTSGPGAVLLDHDGEDSDEAL